MVLVFIDEQLIRVYSNGHSTVVSLVIFRSIALSDTSNLTQVFIEIHLNQVIEVTPPFFFFLTAKYDLSIIIESSVQNLKEIIIHLSIKNDISIHFNPFQSFKKEKKNC